MILANYYTSICYLSVTMGWLVISHAFKYPYYVTPATPLHKLLTTMLTIL
jgi:hypothetical protein